MLSYHADMDINTNPYGLGLDRLVNLDMEADFIGKAALRRIRNEGVSRKHIGLLIDRPALTGPNTNFWDLEKDGVSVGTVTSAVYSPRLQRNIALALVSAEFADLGTTFDVEMSDGRVSATVVERPFYDPRKTLAAA
jgi:aminomethyltransferase